MSLMSLIFRGVQNEFFFLLGAPRREKERPCFLAPSSRLLAPGCWLPAAGSRLLAAGTRRATRAQR